MQVRALGILLTCAQSRRSAITSTLLVTWMAGGCAPPAATRAGASANAAAVPPSARLSHTPADVQFMQRMLHHHAQALEMTRLAQARAATEEVKVLAARIDVSQRDEIASIERWLRDRNEPVAPRHEQHTAMPGMLSAQHMAQLSSATGAEFDRLFLSFMIQHHKGALTMVGQLFATPGAAQDVSVFRFASEVETDQTTEIERMRIMLATRSKNGNPQ